MVNDDDLAQLSRGSTVRTLVTKTVHPHELAASLPRRGDYRYAVSNSVGFGAHNVVLVFGAY